MTNEQIEKLLSKVDMQSVIVHSHDNKEKISARDKKLVEKILAHPLTSSSK